MSFPCKKKLVRNEIWKDLQGVLVMNKTPQASPGHLLRIKMEGKVSLHSQSEPIILTL